MLAFSDTISEKTRNYTLALFLKCGKEAGFGRAIVENIIGLKLSGASKLIKLLVASEVIEPVTGHEKRNIDFNKSGLRKRKAIYLDEQGSRKI